MNYADARAVAQDIISEWSYDDDKHGFTHERPVWIALLDELDAREQTIARMQAQLDAVDAQLRHAGIEYPLGAKGVRDLASMYLHAREDRAAVDHR